MRSPSPFSQGYQFTPNQSASNYTQMGASGGGGGFQPSGLGASLGGLLGGLFGGQKDPSDAAMKYYQQIPGAISPYYQPYINAGKNAMGQLMPQYGQLTNDPSGMLAKLGTGYQQSPGYQFQMQQALGAAQNSASAGGMSGSPEAQQFAAQAAGNVANQDYNSWLQNVLGLYQTGIGGLSGINTMGYNASNEYAGDVANALQNQGNLAYQGQADKNKQSSDMWGSLGGIAGGLVGLR